MGQAALPRRLGGGGYAVGQDAALWRPSGGRRAAERDAVPQCPGEGAIDLDILPWCPGGGNHAAGQDAAPGCSCGAQYPAIG